MTISERRKVIRSVRTLSCYGISPVTDRNVGSRHSWDYLGRCRFCGRTQDQVRIVEFRSSPMDGDAA